MMLHLLKIRGIFFYGVEHKYLEGLLIQCQINKRTVESSPLKSSASQVMGFDHHFSSNNEHYYI